MLKHLFKTIFDKRSDAAAQIDKHLQEMRNLLATGDAASAMAGCKAILAGNTHHLDALLLLADAALECGALQDAIAALQAVVGTLDDAVLHYKFGTLLLESERTGAAMDAFSAAIRRDPSFAKAHNSLGVTLQLAGRMDEAMDCYRQAVSLDSSLWHASYNIGNMLKLMGQLSAAVEPLQNAMRLRRRPGCDYSELSPDDFKTRPSKLEHDVQQLHYIEQQGNLDKQGAQALAALEQARAAIGTEVSDELVLSFAPEIRPLVAPYYNRLLHFYNAPALPGGAVNKNQDWARIEAEYFANGPGMTYIDNFLTPDALASLRRFCLESTIWFDFHYRGGYVGCSCEDGFICPLLVQVTEEMREALPGIIGDSKITGLWGYKYDAQRSGISVHADHAAVNVNFWLTPDEANLDPHSGGLVVWDKEAPLDWSFEEYNNDSERIHEFLRRSGAKPYVVPHRQNRVVLFNSDLFHKTDDYRFKQGYENRRINITMLYGDRQLAPHRSEDNQSVPAA